MVRKNCEYRDTVVPFVFLILRRSQSRSDSDLIRVSRRVYPFDEHVSSVFTFQSGIKERPFLVQIVSKGCIEKVGNLPIELYYLQRMQGLD